MEPARLPDAFEDVNEAVSEEWEAETTPYQRIREVIATAYEPLSADTLAEHARTSPKTTRKHLQALADEGFVATGPGERGGTAYRRSPESLVVEQAAEILAEISVDELVDRIAEMRESIRAFREEYGVESPEELVVEETNEDLSGTAGDRDGIDAEDLREWRTTRRNLAFANAALSIANAERFVGGEERSADTGVSAR